MAIIPVTREALERAVRLASPPKEKEPEIQKRIDATVPIVAEVQVRAARPQDLSVADPLADRSLLAGA